MAYTKTNVAKTLDNAMDLLRAGFHKGDWQCHIATKNFVDEHGELVRSGEVIKGLDLVRARKLGACSKKCCAEGAVELAVGITHVNAYSDKNNRKLKYATSIINALNAETSRNHGVDKITIFNDAGDTTLGDVLNVFKAVKKEILNG